MKHLLLIASYLLLLKTGAQAQAKPKFNSSLLTGTWKCVVERYDSAGRKIVRKVDFDLQYTYTAKGNYKYVIKNGLTTAQYNGTWKLNAKNDSIYYTTPSVEGAWREEIIQLDANKLALRINSEWPGHIYIFEKVPAPKAGGGSYNTRIEPAAPILPAKKE